MRIMNLKWAIGLAVIGLMAFGSMGSAYADGKGLGIAEPGSPHNFTDNMGGDTAGAQNEVLNASGWNWNRREICRVCHVPHDHQKAAEYWSNGLLWNRQVSALAYTMYTPFEAFNGTQDPQPTGSAKLCLGCHDGTIAIDQFDGKPAPVGVFIGQYDGGGFKVPGSGATPSLQGTHPISITYVAGSGPGGPELNGLGTTMGGSGTIGDVLEDGKVQCASCHDVHDSPGESVPDTHLLRVATKGAEGTGVGASGLCLTCHIK